MNSVRDIKYLNKNDNDLNFINIYNETLKIVDYYKDKELDKDILIFLPTKSKIDIIEKKYMKKI